MVLGALRVQFKMIFRIRILYQEDLTESNFFREFCGLSLISYDNFAQKKIKQQNRVPPKFTTFNSHGQKTSAFNEICY